MNEHREREARGSINVSAAAQLPGAPDALWDLIFETSWRTQMISELAYCRRMGS